MKLFPEIGLAVPDALIPVDTKDLDKWAVVACDQYTSQPGYWEDVEAFIDNSPSTFKLILPEAFLGTDKEVSHKKAIPVFMREYLEKKVLNKYEGFIYIEREINGKSRKGLLAALDLELYDFHSNSESLIRATEGTIIDRLPPRIEIRKQAILEIPHILVLIDDPARMVIEQVAKHRSELTKLYDFDLMMGGGHISGYFINKLDIEKSIVCSLKELQNPDIQKKKYSLLKEKRPLLYAVGDGNHSLATAKSVWDQIKDKSDRNHPARFAMVEIVNIHDPAIQFGAIHRILKNINLSEQHSFFDYLKDFCKINGALSIKNMQESVNEQNPDQQVFGLIVGEQAFLAEIIESFHTLPVGSLQNILDNFLSSRKSFELDYIHGKDTLEKLASYAGNIGFYLPTIGKEQLFESVLKDGPLPRKTFSMGEANEKRYYLESRKIK